jgi:hypothetical protein
MRTLEPGKLHMKIFIFSFLLLWFSLSGYAISSDYVEGVYSSKVVKLLNKHVPGWRKAKVFKGAKIFFDNHWPGLSPVEGKGDFNGDGKTDHVVLVESEKGVRAIYIFLNSSEDYTIHYLGIGNHYIVVKPKGTKEFNWDLEAEIELENDTVENVIFRKTATSWIFNNGQFKKFTSAD